MTSKFHKAKNYMKLGADGVNLVSMPDYSNAMIKKIK